MKKITTLTLGDVLPPVFDCTTSVDELGFTPEQMRAAAAAWCELLGVPADDEEARDEAFSDAPLQVVLVALPAGDLLRWWQATEWEFFTPGRMAGGPANSGVGGVGRGPAGLSAGGPCRADAGRPVPRSRPGGALRGGHAVGYWPGTIGA